VSSFLWWIGLYNVVGSVALVLSLHEKLAEQALVKIFQVIVAPYSHGRHGRMWIWWALTSNLALGAIMVQAAHWPHEVQQGVTASVIGVYGIMAVVIAIAAVRPGDRWRAYGIVATLVLWSAQISWGAYGLATSQ
jgi:hypothetical protein